MKLIGKFVGVVAAFTSCSAFATTLLSEGFENINTLPGSGWVLTNNSTAPQTTSWFQGTAPTPFNAAAGSPTSYIAANANNAVNGGAISNWLITPQLALGNGETLNFSLRLLAEFGAIDTVQVYMSTNGASSNVGSTTTSTGDFTLMQTFSAADDTGWVDESLLVSGMSGAGSGRFAFRYVVGDTNINGDYIGIDSVSVESARANAPGVPEPATWALFGVALGAIGLARRRPSISLGRKQAFASNRQH